MLYSILAFGLFMGKGGGGFDGYVESVIDKLDEQYQEKNAAVEHLDEEIAEKSSALSQTTAELADKQTLL